MKKILMCAAIVTATGLSGAASADVGIGISIGIPGIIMSPAPVYVAPPPVYYAPPPVVVAPPVYGYYAAPVVRPPIVVSGAWFGGGQRYYHGRGHGHGKHHHHRRHDR